jgi:hypothetical protein
MGDQQERTSGKPAVLLLGTGHWANPGRDMLNVRYDDMLSPRRQAEIQECIERLKRFQPTKIALEALADKSGELNEKYRRYRAGSFSLTASEVHQLGFRLAAELDHNQVYAIDWQGAIGWDRAFSFARDHEQSARLDEDLSRLEREINELNARMAETSVLDLLRGDNDPERLERGHQAYMHLALVGEGYEYVGADVISNWYARNLKIFVNLARIAGPPQDRVLVIIGSGHVPLLAHFVQSSGLYTLEPAEHYLSSTLYITKSIADGVSQPIHV